MNTGGVLVGMGAEYGGSEGMAVGELLFLVSFRSLFATYMTASYVISLPTE
jgi:hypothetical protein